MSDFEKQWEVAESVMNLNSLSLHKLALHEFLEVLDDYETNNYDERGSDYLGAMSSYWNGFRECKNMFKEYFKIGV